MKPTLPYHEESENPAQGQQKPSGSECGRPQEDEQEHGSLQEEKEEASQGPDRKQGSKKMSGRQVRDHWDLHKGLDRGQAENVRRGEDEGDPLPVGRQQRGAPGEGWIH